MRVGLYLSHFPKLLFHSLLIVGCMYAFICPATLTSLSNFLAALAPP